MAKKTVAKGKKAERDRVKIIRSIKTDSGRYTFKEEMVPKDQVQELLKKN